MWMCEAARQVQIGCETDLDSIYDSFWLSMSLWQATGTWFLTYSNRFLDQYPRDQARYPLRGYSL